MPYCSMIILEKAGGASLIGNGIWNGYYTDNTYTVTVYNFDKVLAVEQTLKILKSAALTFNARTATVTSTLTSN